MQEPEAAVAIARKKLLLKETAETAGGRIRHGCGWLPTKRIEPMFAALSVTEFRPMYWADEAEKEQPPRSPLALEGQAESSKIACLAPSVALR